MLVQVNPELRRELSKLRTRITIIAVIMLFALVLLRLAATEIQWISIDNLPSSTVWWVQKN